ncbi:STAS domain-containing protein [Streptosporangium sp. CA-135522]|uniref:STAS domain-containing protein n=1 Tax=Streptosporangium sp. CA-135522 TaxID=3240072 RepID=UPI003D91A190
MTKLSITVTDHRACSVITLTGELDRFSVGRLRRVIDRMIGQGRARIVADVADLTFCDSAGVWALLEGHHRAAMAGGWLRLAYAHGTLKRILQVSRSAGICLADIDLMVVMDR